MIVATQLYLIYEFVRFHHRRRLEESKMRVLEVSPIVPHSRSVTTHEDISTTSTHQSPKYGT